MGCGASSAKVATEVKDDPNLPPPGSEPWSPKYHPRSPQYSTTEEPRSDQDNEDQELQPATSPQGDQEFLGVGQLPLSDVVNRAVAHKAHGHAKADDAGPPENPVVLKFRAAVKKAVAMRTIYNASVRDDGAINFLVEANTVEGDAAQEEGADAPTVDEAVREEEEEGVPSVPVPPLNIVILIVGTRGDVQPFIAIGNGLKNYGHRVRLASHANYRDFVTENGLEFFPLGGDPKILAEYMVKNKGFFPSSAAEVKQQREQLGAIIRSTFAACTEPDRESGGALFVADAIIANPPAYGHIHCAEKLAVPLHMFFTMPWSPTRAFPHPLARMSNAKPHRYENRVSYFAVDSLVYNGVADMLNRFREETLALPKIRLGEGAASLLHSHRVPFAYCWSPTLVPRPSDWGSHIDVLGFFFLDLASSYTPPQDLKDFLAAGPPPVYVGFGSLVVKDPDGMTKIIYEAFEKTGQRCLLSSGWAGLGAVEPRPSNVFIVGNCPHDWLFLQCSGVVHHGGAGTTAAGLLAKCPTTIVPFFGDQPFWGGAVERMGVGPAPIPVDDFALDRLVAALEFMQQPEVKAKVSALSDSMAKEDGVKAGVAAFHKHLPLDVMICDTCPREQGCMLAKQYCTSCDVKLCHACDAAIHLMQHSSHERQPYRYIDWSPRGPGFITDALVQGAGGFASELTGALTGVLVEPIVGGMERGVGGAIVGAGKGLAELVTRPLKGGVIFIDKISEGMNNAVDHMFDSNKGVPMGTHGDEPRSPSGGLFDGLAAGGKELIEKTVGGVTGLFLEPVKGAMEGGGKGFAKGAGRPCSCIRLDARWRWVSCPLLPCGMALSLWQQMGMEWDGMAW
eukprot:jgi/Mesvir1/2883/Mv13959-RA.2